MKAKLEYVPYPYDKIPLKFSFSICQLTCDRLNVEHPDIHFKPQRIGSKYQIVAAKIIKQEG